MFEFNSRLGLKKSTARLTACAVRDAMCGKDIRNQAAPAERGGNSVRSERPILVRKKQVLGEVSQFAFISQTSGPGRHVAGFKRGIDVAARHGKILPPCGNPHTLDSTHLMFDPNRYIELGPLES